MRNLGQIISYINYWDSLCLCFTLDNLYTINMATNTWCMSSEFTYYLTLCFIPYGYPNFPNAIRAKNAVNITFFDFKVNIFKDLMTLLWDKFKFSTFSINIFPYFWQINIILYSVLIFCIDSVYLDKNFSIFLRSSPLSYSCSYAFKPFS